MPDLPIMAIRPACCVSFVHRHLGTPIMPLAEVANIDQRCYCLLHIEARMALLHILHSPEES